MRMDHRFLGGFLRRLREVGRAHRVILFSLMALCSIHLLANLWWLSVDTRPPFWDTAGHAIFATQLLQSFSSGTLDSAIRGFLAVNPYPPFTYLAVLPLALMFGPQADAFTLGMTIFLCILILSVYGIARQFHLSFAGLVAAFLTSMYPIVYGLSRHFLLEIPLVAMVALAVYCLLTTEDFSRRTSSVGFGVVLGLGMLTKWTFAVFIAAPLLISIGYAFMNWSSARLKNLVLAGIVATGIPLPWYVHNFSNLTSFLQVNDLYAVLKGDPQSTWMKWSYYALQLVQAQILLPFTLAFVAGLALLMARHKNTRMKLILLAWVVVPYVVLSAFVNKDLRYTMPYLPAIALITAAGLSEISSPKMLRITMAVMVAYAVFQFAGLTMGLSRDLSWAHLPPRVSVELGQLPLPVYTEAVHIASPPVAENWETQEILEDVTVDASGSLRGNPGHLSLLVLPNAAFFEPEGFIYFTEVLHLPITVSSATGAVPVDGNRALVNSDYVVTKTGNMGPVWSLQDAVALNQRIQMPNDGLGQHFTLIKTYPLPDGSVASLYRHQPAR